MTTPSELPATEEAAPLEGRLHPWSWLFALIAQLQSFAVPLIALLVFGGRSNGDERWQFIGMLAGLVIVVVSVVQYFTYRYGVVGDDLVIREGILHRNRRNIPMQRIRNVSLQQNLLHRLFGVAEVRLESAGGHGAEAKMRVLSLAAANQLESLIESHHGTETGGNEKSDDGETATPPLLQLGAGELTRLGLVSNRGMVVVGATAAAFWQLVPDDADNWIGDGAKSLFGQALAAHLGWLGWTLAIIALVLAAMVALRMLSIALAFVQYHGFALRSERGRLSVERGLLNRVRANAPPKRIQFWNRRESLLQRWLGRQSLQVETAVGMQEDGASSAITQLAPIAPPAVVDDLLGRLLPAHALDGLDWRPIHPRAWRRMVKWPLWLLLAASATLTWLIGWSGLLPLLLAPWLVWSKRRLAASRGWALNDHLISWRSGWLGWQQSFAEVNKLQGVQLLQSPFDRRHGMARLLVDTAGAHPLSGNLRIDMSYLPEADARELYRRLAQRIASTPLAW